MANANTFQTNIHNHNMENITEYALFLGGLNVTRDSLLQYDPLKTGFGRVFMIRTPIFVTNKIPDKMRKFKHVLEYANTAIEGNDNIELTTNDMSGGYSGKKVTIPNIATDGANDFSIKVYEFSGSLMREVIQYWINGISDIQSGLSHYYCDGTPNDVNYGLPICQANQSAEFIYVATDQSGKEVEYAALFANCVPTNIQLDQFNYTAGEHNLVEMNITFTASRYMSPQINEKAKQLLVKHNALMNSLNFNSGYTNDQLYPAGDYGTYYDLQDGKLKNKSAAQKNTFIVT